MATALPSPAERASDADRERVTLMLQRHVGDGRLTLDEFSDRLELAFAARTGEQLRESLRDLPALPAAALPPTSTELVLARRRLRGERRSYLTLMVVLLAIWALTGADYFWPVWPMLGWGIPLALQHRAAYGPEPSVAAVQGSPGCGGRRRGAGLGQA